MPKPEEFTLAGVSCVSLLFSPDRPLSMCQVGIFTVLATTGVGVGVGVGVGPDEGLFGVGEGDGEGDVVFALTPPQPAIASNAAEAAMVIASLWRRKKVKVEKILDDVWKVALTADFMAGAHP